MLNLSRFPSLLYRRVPYFLCLHTTPEVPLKCMLSELNSHVVVGGGGVPLCWGLQLDTGMLVFSKGDKIWSEAVVTR